MTKEEAMTLPDGARVRYKHFIGEKLHFRNNRLILELRDEFDHLRGECAAWPSECEILKKEKTNEPEGKNRLSD